MSRTQTLGRDAAEATAPRTLEYQPALDGVRAVSVIAVLLFHAEVSLFSGGYLGVSVFFTLSGFLITSLLVSEIDGTGRVQLARFYARRARRLLPASLACIAGIIVIAGVTDWFDGVGALRRQAVGSVLQVANWVFLFGGGSYQELFEQNAGAVSPLEHFWSLAIEQQFYWLWPLLFVGLARVARSDGSRVRVIGTLTVATAVAAPVIAWVWGADAAYWSTPARLAEIFVGALLAVVLFGRQVSPRWAYAAPVALAALVVAMVTFPAASGPAYWGALPLVALASGALLLGLHVDSPVRRGLSTAPLVWLGRISYGVYLYHWPVYVIMNPDRMGVDGVGLIAMRLAVTLAIAQLSSTLLEQPIRRAQGLTLRPTLIGLGAATAAAVTAAVIVIPASNFNYWSVPAETADAVAIDEVDEPLDALTATPAAVPSATPTTAAPVETPPDTTVAKVADTVPVRVDDSLPDSVAVPPIAAPTTTAAQLPLPTLARPARIFLVGDSTAEATGLGIVQWAALNPDLAQASVSAEPGCGFLRGGERFVFQEWQDNPSGCDRWVTTTITNRVERLQPDVVALMASVWDMANRRFDDGPIMTTTTVEMTERIEAEYLDLTERVLDAGAGTVAWIAPPIVDNGVTDRVERNQVLLDAMDAVAERYPQVYVVDLRGFLAATTMDVDPAVRPDGTHFTAESSLRIAQDYLGEQLIRAALALDPR